MLLFSSEIYRSRVVFGLDKQHASLDLGQRIFQSRPALQQVGPGGCQHIPKSPVVLRVRIHAFAVQLNVQSYIDDTERLCNWQVCIVSPYRSTTQLVAVVSSQANTAATLTDASLVKLAEQLYGIQQAGAPRQQLVVVDPAKTISPPPQAVQGLRILQAGTSSM